MLTSRTELQARIDELENILPDMMFWARRYANGRHTSVSDVFRQHYNFIKKQMPELLPKHDDTIRDDANRYMKDSSQPTDWLIDCND